MDEEILRWLEETKLKNEFYKFIKRPDAFRRMFAGLSGWGWEDEIEAECKQRGFAWKPSYSKHSPYDGEINGLRVQCKATCCKKNAIDLRCKKTKFNRRYEVTDFDVLALKVVDLSGSVNYFIPSVMLVDADNPLVMVRSVSLKTLDNYKDDWTVFDRSLITLKKDYDKPLLEISREEEKVGEVNVPTESGSLF